MISGQFIEGAADSEGSPINHVGIDHRRADIVIVFEKMGCEAVTESMGSHPFRDIRSF